MAGIYVHFPFCYKKCNYCNFYSLASQKNITPYVGALVKEITLQKNYLNNEIIESLYFGGGTPTLLTLNHLSLVLDEIFKNYNIATDCEITIEANPENLNNEYLVGLLNLGFNRLSVGVQSFFDDDLIYLDRNHSSTQIIKAIENSQKSGFKNISIDLIYGIPSLSNERWLTNIEKALEFDIPHISAYCLTIENKTPLELYIKKSKLQAPSEEVAIDQMEILMKVMQSNNYIHYEISNFCKEGNFSKHNSNYWKQKKYLGLGPSAHSFNGFSRQWNISQIAKYIETIDSNILNFEYENLTENQKFNENILTGIRTIWGIDAKKIKHDFGEVFFNKFKYNVDKLVKNKLVENEGSVFKLTKQGKLFADKVTLELFID